MISCREGSASLSTSPFTTRGDSTDILISCGFACTLSSNPDAVFILEINSGTILFETVFGKTISPIFAEISPSSLFERILFFTSGSRSERVSTGTTPSTCPPFAYPFSHGNTEAGTPYDFNLSTYPYAVFFAAFSFSTSSLCFFALSKPCPFFRFLVSIVLCFLMLFFFLSEISFHVSLFFQASVCLFTFSQASLKAVLASYNFSLRALISFPFWLSSCF